MRQIVFTSMALAENFQEILESLPNDWTDLEIDLRINEDARYVDAAVDLSMINAKPYSHSDWHWRLLVAHRFGHGAAAPTVLGVLGKLDASGITGEMRLREMREGRAEVVPMWGRPESAREEFRKRRTL